MKPDPTGLNREAATIFRPASGMRALMSVPSEDGRASVEVWCRVIGLQAVVEEPGALWWRDSDLVSLLGRNPLAFDMDDHATVGACVGQVEDQPGVGVVELIYDAGMTDRAPGWRTHLARGVHPTRGAATVAAMRAVKR